MASGKYIGIGAGIVIIIAAILIAVSQAPEDAISPIDTPEAPEPVDIEPAEVEPADAPEPAETAEMELSGEIEIGSLLPLSGRLSGHGEENLAGTEFGVIKFNEHLESIGATWSIKLVSEDTATNQQVALDKITTLNAKGVKMIIGPETSANTKHVKPYADSNGMLLVSCCSTAPALAIADDSVYRLVADDTNQGPALAALMAGEGMEVMVPIWRSDTYGDGLQKTATEAFVANGGTVDEGIPYSPDTQEFSVSTSLLADIVLGHVDRVGAEKVGVLYIGFSEIQQFAQSGSDHEVLNQVRWFGPDGATKQKSLTTDPLASEFAETVKFTSLQIAAAENPVYVSVQEFVEEKLGREPSTFAHSSYDAVWLIGLAMLETDSTDVDAIKAELHGVAEDYDNAALGSIKLNEAGDLAEADYEIWGVRDGEWKLLGVYAFSDGSITFN
ncbi:MAG: ABC transporter substrate-binding protein [Nitrosopumilus sp. H13]|nr:MAG: ABC transporter substrate-binding protein [Nitrosopumilus sp. H13]